VIRFSERDPCGEHFDRVAADRVHLRVELDAEHAIPQIDEAGARVAANDRRPLLRGAQNLQIRRGGWCCSKRCLLGR
jgi:hypothetical protein